MLAALRKHTDEPGLEQLDTRKKPESAARPDRGHKTRLRLTAMVAAVAIVATSGLAWVASRGGRGRAAFSAVTKVIAGVPAAPVESPGNTAAPNQTAATVTARRRHTAPSAANSHRHPGETRRENPGALVAGIPSLVPSVTSVRTAMPSRHLSSATEPVQTYEIIASEPGPSTSDLIYSTADSEVTPPRQVYPALPAEPPTGYLKRALTLVDLVIAPDGLVERVHLRTPPRDIHEFMLLSAAKAWRFQPALLDGRPVRFRHSVALTSFR